MVILTLTVIGLVIAIRRLLRLHRRINGAWVTFLFNWFLVKRYSKLRPKDRLNLHDLYSNELEHMGHVPFKQEQDYAKPKKNQSEQLFILASNTGTSSRLQVTFTRTPLPHTAAQYDDFEPLKDNVTLAFNYHDAAGDDYYIEQTDSVEHSEKEYRAFGFAFEPLQANKQGRIKFRGYLRRRSDNTLHYVKMRLLCTAFNTVLDHSFIRNRCFMITEMMSESSLANSVTDLSSILDDRQEQWSHLRGTVQFESEKAEVVHFISTVGRRVHQRSSAIEKVTHLWAFTQQGYGLYLGVVELSSGKSYRYGVVNQRSKRFVALKECSLESRDLLTLIQNAENNAGSSILSAEFGNKNISIKLEGRGNKCFINQDEGTYFVTTFTPLRKSSRALEQAAQQYVPQSDLVVTLENRRAKLVPLSGGKGASLSQLCHLSKKAKIDFIVPKAIIVTTEAYLKQTERNVEFQKRLKSLQDVAYDTTEDKPVDLEKVKAECEKLQKWFESQELLPETKAEIEDSILREFGDVQSLQTSGTMFAVRSSASTEDSEEMSTAGQMSTLLGVSGQIAHISKAVMACWASQFGFVAIEYKRGYGQSLDSPMAVVIQEMVDSQSAGVVFTAHPTSGDERFLTMTSNFGLGESVVSAAADPDTFEVQIDVSGPNRKALAIASRRIGSKALVTRMSKPQEGNDDNIENIANEESTEFAQKSSLTDEQVLEIANCSLEIQAHYGNARDIEWGIIDGKLYIFQSRPITNLDSGFTDWELMNEVNSPHDSETEVYSRAHWGENFPGSGSIAASTFFASPAVMARQMMMQGTLKKQDYNVFKAPMGMVNQQLMFNMRYGMFASMFKDYPKSRSAKSQVMAFFGRQLTDEKVLQVFRDNDNLNEEGGMMVKFLKNYIVFPILMVYILFFAHKNLPKVEHKIFKEWAGTQEDAVRRVPLKDKFRLSMNMMGTRFVEVKLHGFLSMASGFKSMALESLLTFCGKPSETTQQDFNLLMGHCSDVVSAEVPNTLRLIAKKIPNKEAFKNMDDKTALETLKSGKAGEEPKRIFEEFLQNHGHRGYREFDPYYKTWGWDPIPCVQVIISMLKGGGSLDPREEVPIPEVIAQLKTPLWGWQKWILEKWMLAWCRAGVGYRERTKSMMIRMGYDSRCASWHIGREMVKNGYLPSLELMFFLKIDELESLLNGSRDPMLVKKAKQRLRVYPTLNALKFDEFQFGFNMEPRKKKPERIILDDSAVKLTGTPVTVGSIKARVCVAETIEEANQIQQGDILITYSTDIGWSPYFPLISGIVTEIGGTISHGAVIAREFGIPCLIAVDDACHEFKTGDIAFLDADSGSIVRVKQ